MQKKENDKKEKKAKKDSKKEAKQKKDDCAPSETFGKLCAELCEETVSENDQKKKKMKHEHAEDIVNPSQAKLVTETKEKEKR